LLFWPYRVAGETKSGQWHGSHWFWQSAIG